MSADLSSIARHARLMCAAEQTQSTFAAILALCSKTAGPGLSGSDSSAAPETLEAEAAARQICAGIAALCSQHLERSVRDVPGEIEGADAVFAWRCAQADMLYRQAESTERQIAEIARKGFECGTGVRKGFWEEAAATRVVNVPFRALCQSIGALCQQHRNAPRP